MSRGHWEYKDQALKSDIFGWGIEPDKVPNVLGDKEISEIVYDVFGLLYDADSYFSADSDEADYKKAIDKFKKKWNLKKKTKIEWKCDSCGKEFPTKWELEEHIGEVHQNDQE